MNSVVYFLLIASALIAACRSQFTGPGRDAQHWCCKVDDQEPRPLLQTSKVVHYEKQTVAVRTGYEGCGLWGTGRCSLYTARYKAVQKYGISYRQTALFEDCPKRHLVCCAQYHLIAGQCMHGNTLNAHIDKVEFLHGLGVLHTGGDDSGKK